LEGQYIGLFFREKRGKSQVGGGAAFSSAQINVRALEGESIRGTLKGQGQNREGWDKNKKANLEKKIRKAP